jgi:hypothetical protein
MEDLDFNQLAKEGAGFANKNGIDPVGYKEMCDMMKKVRKDPEMKKQMEGYW